MKGKVIWLIFSSLMVLSLVATACAPAVVEKPEVTEKPKLEEITEKPEVVEKPEVEKPKYGGTITVFNAADIDTFDGTGTRPTSRGVTLFYTNESLAVKDWTKGWAGGYGSRETKLDIRNDLWRLKAGVVAESWELPKERKGDTGVVTYRIRRGINWALNPKSEASRLVGGRGLTTEDVLWSLKLNQDDPSQFLAFREPELKRAKITSPEPWTIQIEAPWDIWEMVLMRTSEYMLIFPPEVYKKYGNMRDWRVSVGTGPFILTSNVPGASATLVRNPNYWGKDPIGPGKGNQLPYVDEVKILIIPDKSTQLAAFRTGKIDYMSMNKEELELALKSQPKLRYRMAEIDASSAIGMRTDRAPFNDIRVRQAMAQAIDFEAINAHYFGGEGQIVSTISYVTDYSLAYYGPDPETGVWPGDATEFSKELYRYDPEKAKRLLAEAGYPNGFKTNIYIKNTTDVIDYMSIYKGYWAKVGIDLELRPEEDAASVAREATSNYDQMFKDGNPSVAFYHEMLLWIPGQARNLSFVNDPKINEVHPKIQAVRLFDEAESMRLFREAAKYAHDQVWYIPQVLASSYKVWWPWVKNFNGESNLGNMRRHVWDYAWLDRELKKSMGY